MTLSVRVSGGTDAGTKRPLREPRDPWKCPECGRENPGYWARCLHRRCNEKRPD